MNTMQNDRIEDMVYQLTQTSIAMQNYCELVLLKLGFSSPICHEAIRIRREIELATAVSRKLLESNPDTLNQIDNRTDRVLMQIQAMAG